MGAVHIDAPPRLADEQAYRYLVRIAQDLNLALTSIDEGNMTPAAAEKLTTGGASAQTARADTETMAAMLKGLIVKTAATVKQEMDALELRLDGTYVAQSVFGDYKDETKAKLDLLPQYIEQSIHDSQEIEGITNEIGGLAKYREETEAHIKIGIVGYEGDSMTPVVGIAIGRKIQTSGTVDKDNETYDVIASGQTLATYTSDGLHFYIAGTEVAYLTNSMLYILNAEVSGSIKQGSWLWEQDSEKGLTLRYVG